MLLSSCLHPMCLLCKHETLLYAQYGVLKCTHVNSSCVLQVGSIMIPFFQQFTGINTIMFYATQLFDVLGYGQKASLLNTAIIGAVNVGSTILAIIIVDR